MQDYLEHNSNLAITKYITSSNHKNVKMYVIFQTSVNHSVTKDTAFLNASEIPEIALWFVGTS